MASLGAPKSADGDWAEHERTYKAFLLIIKIGGSLTAITLLALYFILAR